MSVRYDCCDGIFTPIGLETQAILKVLGDDSKIEAVVRRVGNEWTIWCEFRTGDGKLRRSQPMPLDNNDFIKGDGIEEALTKCKAELLNDSP